MSNASIQVELSWDLTCEYSLCEYMQLFKYLEYHFNIRSCLLKRTSFLRKTCLRCWQRCKELDYMISKNKSQCFVISWKRSIEQSSPPKLSLFHTKQLKPSDHKKTVKVWWSDVKKQIFSFQQNVFINSYSFSER